MAPELSEITYFKAVRFRGFDVTRGKSVPVKTVMNLSWKINPSTAVIVKPNQLRRNWFGFTITAVDPWILQPTPSDDHLTSSNWFLYRSWEALGNDILQWDQNRKIDDEAHQRIRRVSEIHSLLTVQASIPACWPEIIRRDYVLIVPITILFLVGTWVAILLHCTWKKVNEIQRTTYLLLISQVILYQALQYLLS